MNLLFLLIGSNPLPNYIVARYLLSANAEKNDLPVPDKIICIHTERTNKFTDTLSKALPANATMIEKLDLGQNGRNPKRIRTEITKKLQEIENGESEIRSIHLNYIGGTKTMAVQAALALKEWIKDKPNIKYILSDVDPDLDKIIFSETGLGLPIGRELKELVKLTTKELLQLHGMKINSPGHEELRLADEDLVRLCKIKLQAFRDSNQNANKNNNSEEFLSRVKATLGQKFLDGGWLEEFVLRSLVSLKAEDNLQIDEARANIYAQFNKRQTEIDAIVIKGYQLFLFTCATAKKIGSVKLKAFEALYRANQLGGEHAKVIIVCTLHNDYNNKEPNNSFQNVNNLKELKKDLMQFDAQRNCRLIGFNELVGEIEGRNSLTNAIKHILEGGK